MIHMFITGGYGGIGRRARFRFWWETVQVRVLLSAAKTLAFAGVFYMEKILCQTGDMKTGDFCIGETASRKAGI